MISKNQMIAHRFGVLIFTCLAMSGFSCRENSCNDVIYHYIDNQYAGINCCSSKYNILPIVTELACGDAFVLVEQRPEIEYQKHVIPGGLQIDIESIKNGCNCKTKIANKLIDITYTSIDTMRLESLSLLLSGKNSKLDQLTLLRYAEILLQKDSFYIQVNENPINYWIIETLEDTIFQYGPMSLREYAETRKRLNVPKSLRLSVDK